MSVTLIDVFAAARVRRASVVGETAGSVVLVLADQLVAAPRRLSAAAIHLLPEGQLVLGEAVATSASSCEAALRRLLGGLLELGRGATPALVRASHRPPRGDLAGFVRELEGALIPVNRAAGRRALARLYRETARALATGLPPAARQAGAELAASLREGGVTPDEREGSVATDSLPVAASPGATTSRPAPVVATEVADEVTERVPMALEDEDDRGPFLERTVVLEPIARRTEENKAKLEAPELTVRLDPMVEVDAAGAFASAPASLAPTAGAAPIVEGEVALGSASPAARTTEEVTRRLPMARSGAAGTPTRNEAEASSACARSGSGSTSEAGTGNESDLAKPTGLPRLFPELTEAAPMQAAPHEEVGEQRDYGDAVGRVLPIDACWSGHLGETFSGSSVESIAPEVAVGAVMASASGVDSSAGAGDDELDGSFPTTPVQLPEVELSPLRAEAAEESVPRAESESASEVEPRPPSRSWRVRAVEGVFPPAVSDVDELVARFACGSGEAGALEAELAAMVDVDASPLPGATVARPGSPWVRPRRPEDRP